MATGTMETILGLILIAGFLASIWMVASRRSRPAAPPSIPPAAPRAQPPSSPGPVENIFLSYAAEDRPQAKVLAEALGTRGWPVWWDRTILAGQKFDDAIEAALAQARCVIVLWSRASVASDWVKTEAAEGAQRRILVPVLIEDVKIPFEFRRIQAANLVGWNANPAHQSFENLLESVTALMGPAGGRA
jgi:hypothetical protein